MPDPDLEMGGDRKSGRTLTREMSASGIQNLGLWNPEYPRLCWALLNPLNYVGGFVSEILLKRNKKESQF